MGWTYTTCVLKRRYICEAFVLFNVYIKSPAACNNTDAACCNGQKVHIYIYKITVYYNSQARPIQTRDNHDPAILNTAHKERYLSHDSWTIFTVHQFVTSWQTSLLKTLWHRCQIFARQLFDNQTISNDCQIYNCRATIWQRFHNVFNKFVRQLVRHSDDIAQYIYTVVLINVFNSDILSLFVYSFCSNIHSIVRQYHFFQQYRQLLNCRTISSYFHTTDDTTDVSVVKE